MGRFVKWGRLSAICSFFIGIISVIQGCDIKEGALFALMLFGLNFCSAPVAPPEPESIVMFSISSTTHGSPAVFGGRAGADTLCRSFLPTDIASTNVRAFISVNSDDEIQDMPGLYSIPTNLVVEGPTGVTIANNWADLLDGSIETTLQSAGVSSGAAWWSGSIVDGSVTASTCNGWTSPDGTPYTGTVGLLGEFGPMWMDSLVPEACNQSFTILCLAY